jgi:hypothetical protein
MNGPGNLVIRGLDGNRQADDRTGARTTFIFQTDKPP